MSSTTSSPSMYSRPASNIGHGHAYAPSPRMLSSRLRDLTEMEEQEDDRRMSVVSGPTLRKYADDPWADDCNKSTTGEFGRNATRLVKGMRSRSKSRPRQERQSPMANAAFNRSTQYTLSPSVSEAETVSDTRKALYDLVSTKRLAPSPSGLSIRFAGSNRSSSSNSTISSAPVLQTPRQSTVMDDPKPLLDGLETYPTDRPLVQSGSPGFALISLEAAQEKMRTPASPVRLRQKKSGLLRLFKATKPQADSRSSRGSMWSNDGDDYPKFQDEISAATLASVRPQLELRPMSMTFKGLPTDYLAADDATPFDEAIELSNEQLHANARKAWQVKVYELEAQIRELRDELDAKHRHNGPTCRSCGCQCGGPPRQSDTLQVPTSVMDRARAKTAGARGVFGSGSLYEWE